MKLKRICEFIILSCMVFSTACTKPVNNVTEEESSVKETEIELETEGAEEENKTTEAPILLSYQYDNYVAVLNGDGTSQTIDLVYDEEEELGSVCMDSGFVYFTTNRYDDNNQNTYSIYQIDIDNQQTTKIISKQLDSGMYYNSLDVENGKISFNRNTYTDDGSSYATVIYEQDESGTYQETIEDEDIYNAILNQGYDLIYALCTDGESGYYTIPYCRKTFGTILAWDQEAKDIVVLNEQGELQQTIDLPKDDAGIQAIDENYILYRTNTEEKWQLIMRDLETQEEMVLTEQPSDVYWNFMYIQDGFLYYNVTETVNLRMSHYYIYQCNLSNGQTRLLYETETLPGTGWYYQPGVSGFFVDNQICYFLGMDETQAAWYHFDASDENAKVTPLNIVSKHFDFTDYGSIVYETDIATCPICGVQDHEIYVEKFILNDDYENAEIINEQLEQEMQEELAFVPDEATMEGEHEWHSDDFFIPETYDRTIGSVQIFGKHYFEVNYNHYIYMGGAHGEPAITHSIFDLDSGKKVSFTDFYTGTEEEFKKIVADYTTAYWRENKEIFFESSEKNFYQQVYESTTLDRTIKFDTDGIVVEYPPYELGPYAAGYISVAIPYEELGISF